MTRFETITLAGILLSMLRLLAGLFGLGMVLTGGVVMSLAVPDRSWGGAAVSALVIIVGLFVAYCAFVRVPWMSKPE